MLGAEPAFQKRARVDARGGVALEINQVARLIPVIGVKEMIESDFQQRGQRGISGNVAADAGVVLILVDHHGHGVPADHAFDPPLHGAVARIRQLRLRSGIVFMYGVLRWIGNSAPAAAARLFSRSNR